MNTEILNFVKTPKQREYNTKLEEKAAEFHGHGGPFMIIGLRMGLAALDSLDSWGWFGISCKVFLRWTPPHSCIIDGIQSSTGCTMGKHNIEAEESDGLSAEFMGGEKSVRITLKESVLSSVSSCLDDGDEVVEKYMAMLRKASVNDLFIIESKD